MGQFDLRTGSCPELDQSEAAFRTTKRKSIGYMRTAKSQNNHFNDPTIEKKTSENIKKKMSTLMVLNPTTEKSKTNTLTTIWKDL